MISRIRARGKGGFTLVELLMVMAIIALLAALVGPKLFSKPGKGKQSAAKAQIELIGQAWISSGSMWAGVPQLRRA